MEKSLLGMEETLKHYTLADIFKDYLKSDIYEIAKRKGIRGISKCNKEALIEKLSEALCKPEMAEKYFLCLLDEQIEEFKKAAAEEGFYYSKNVKYIEELYAGAYIGILSDGRVSVPQETAAVYQLIDKEAFHQKRRRVSFLLACLRTSGFLHGIAPIEIVLKMINQNCKPAMTVDEFRMLFEEIPAELKEHVLVGDMMYHEMLYPNDRNLLAVQNGKPYYIPTVKEIKDFNLHRYFSEGEEILRFKQYLLQKTNMREDEAEEAVERIQRAMCGAEMLSEIIGNFENFGIEMGTAKEVGALIEQVEILWNKTRMLVNRGFKPEELRTQRTKVSSDKSGKIIHMKEVRKNKIYPNEPCPCGSGKKYKNCCRNK